MTQLKTSDETAVRLAELERAATDGPWFHNGVGNGDARAVWNTDGGGDPIPHDKEVQICQWESYRDDDSEIPKLERDANIRLIAEARNALPDLLADRAQQVADRATAARLLRARERVRARREHYAARFVESPNLFDHDMLEELDEVLAILDEDETRKEKQEIVRLRGELERMALAAAKGASE